MSNLISLDRFFEETRSKKVLVIGDVMVDQYLSGKVSRISPEAPVPVLDHQQTQHTPGGAANVALNIIGLASDVWIWSAIGKDPMGEKIHDLLKAQGVQTDLLFAFEERMTTCKTRIMAGNQHLLRVDQERRAALEDHHLDLMLAKLGSLLLSEDIDVAILQDYNKGIFTQKSIARLLSLLANHQLDIVVDPKIENFYSYQRATIFKPNLAELRASVPFEVTVDPASLQKAAAHIRAETSCKIVMITLSDKGIFVDDGLSHHLLPAPKKLIADVCGAGDTVVSVAALAYAAGLDLENMAHWSALCGTTVCQFPGVKPITRALLESEMLTDEGASRRRTGVE
jgi:rfaE bifunctional protein kinase chain/domain